MLVLGKLVAELASCPSSACLLAYLGMDSLLALKLSPVPSGWSIRSRPAFWVHAPVGCRAQHRQPDQT
jgi:hypothetical protein